MKRFFLLALTAIAAISFAACEKQGGENGGGGGTASEKDLIAAWVETDGTEINFTSDGKVAAKYDDGETDTYTWSFKDGKLTVSSSDPDEEDEVYDVIFAAKKNALILAQDNNVKSYAGGRNFMMYYKKGATITSATLSDGRWDCPHWGVKPENPTDPGNDYRFSLIVKGNTMDMYVFAWGFHITYDNHPLVKRMKAEDYDKVDYAKALKLYADRFKDANNFVFTFVGNINPETFAIRPPYVYEEGDPLDNARAFHSFKIVLTDDGKEGYAEVANLVGWFYKR